MSIVCPLPSCYLIIVSVAPAVSPSLPSFVSLYSLLVSAVLCWSVVFHVSSSREFHVHSVPGAHGVRSRACSAPGAHAFRSGPGAHAFRSGPGAHAFRSGPGAHAFHSGPGAHAFRSDPGAHAFRSDPRAHGVRSRARSDPGAQGVRSRARSDPGAQGVRSRARSDPGAQGVRSRARSDPGAQGVCSRARSDPGAHGVRSDPGAHAFRSVPGAHAFRSGPGAHAFRSGPGAHAFRSDPGAHAFRSGPGAHAFRPDPGAHAFRSGPGVHAFHSDPGAHAFRSDPRAHGVRSRARSDPGAQGVRSRARSDPGAPGAHAFRSDPRAHGVRSRARSGPGAHAVRSGLGTQRARSRASPTLAPLCAHCSRPSSTPRAWPTSLLDNFLFSVCGASGIRSLKGGLCHGPAGVPRLATRCLCVLSTWLVVCLVPCAPMSIVCPLPSCYLIIVSVAPAVSPSLPLFVSLYSLLVSAVLCWSVVFHVSSSREFHVDCAPVFCRPACLFFPFGVVFVVHLFHFIIKTLIFLCIWVLDHISPDNHKRSALMQPVFTAVSTSCHAGRGLADHPRCVRVGNGNDKMRLYSPNHSKTTVLPLCARHHSAQRGRSSHSIVPPAQS